MAVKLTVADRLLIAALDLGGSERSSFTAEDLVVAAWQHFPDSFGLRGILDDDGIPLHPDSNRVFAEIMGSKPLRKNGLLDKVGDKRYQLTEAGLRRAYVLSGKEHEDVSRRSLSRPLQDALRRLATSRAREKQVDSRLDAITFHDAASFWGITPRSSANSLEARLAETETVLTEAAIYAGQATVDLGSGREVSSNGISGLVGLHQYLQERFASELAAIRKRTDERKV